MIAKWPAFLGGMMVALTVVWAGYGYFAASREDTAAPPGGVSALPAPLAAAEAPPVLSPGSVTIKILPPLLTLRGQDVPFRGRAEFPQDLGGKLAGEIIVVSFGASGENAHKSVIKIAWEDGSVESIPAGAANLTLSPQRRARKISVQGYCFHEQRVFKDVAKKGALSWEIRYAAAE